MSDIAGHSDPNFAPNGRFLPGNSVSVGRPKGSRNKLAEDFIGDALHSWEKHGAKAFEQMFNKDPCKYVQVIATLVPKELILGQQKLSDVSDDELIDFLLRCRDIASTKTSTEIGVGTTIESTETPARD